jgi:hypothetical protein
LKRLKMSRLPIRGPSSQSHENKARMRIRESKKGKKRGRFWGLGKEDQTAEAQASCWAAGGVWFSRDEADELEPISPEHDRIGHQGRNY